MLGKVAKFKSLYLNPKLERGFFRYICIKPSRYKLKRIRWHSGISIGHIDRWREERSKSWRSFM
jgi:hypothetical protein